MRSYILVTGLGLLSILASGCATLDKEECQKADWFRVGQIDGKMGREASHIANHRNSC